MKKHVFLLSSLFAGKVLASSGVNLYGSAAESLGLSPDSKFLPSLSSVFTLFLLLFLGFFFRSFINKKMSKLGAGGDDLSGEGVVVSFFSLIEALLDFLVSMSKDYGGKYYRSIAPLIAGIFLFILVTNLSGLFPGLPPATQDLSSNLAMAFVSFFVYNALGFKELGYSYLRQFMGPLAAIAPLFFLIELVSHAVRPLSLTVRLTANIFGDHLLLGTFESLVPLFLPAVFLFMGLIVSVVQSYVFTLLTGIYISLAISHDH